MTTRKQQPTNPEVWETPDESTALVPASPAEMAPRYVDSLTDIFDTEDAYLPRLRLAQGLTPEVQDGTARPGQWIVTGFEPRDTVTIVPVRAAKTRTRLDDEGGVLCFSADARTGQGDPGGSCETCPLRHWTTLDDGTRVPPECDVQYRYIVYIAELDCYAVLVCKRTALNAAKLINTVLMARGLGKAAFRLAAASQKSRRGSYFVPSVAPIQAADELLAKATSGLA
jgi:hypothetical protein